MPEARVGNSVAAARAAAPRAAIKRIFDTRTPLMGGPSLGHLRQNYQCTGGWGDFFLRGPRSGSPATGPASWEISRRALGREATSLADADILLAPTGAAVSGSPTWWSRSRPRRPRPSTSSSGTTEDRGSLRQTPPAGGAFEHDAVLSGDSSRSPGHGVEPRSGASRSDSAGRSRRC